MKDLLFGQERSFETNSIKFTPNLYWTGKIVEYININSNMMEQLCEFEIIKEDLIKDYIY